MNIFTILLFTPVLLQSHEVTLSDNAEEIGIAGLSAMLMASVYYIYRLKKQSNTANKENAKLIADNAMHQVELLKEKLQPHAFKNTLAHMNASIKSLGRSMDSLSKMLDYMLYGTEGHFVTPCEEIEFLKDLVQFHAQRIDQIDMDPKIQIDPKSAFIDRECLPHLVSSYFIENALKHGDIHADDFLDIEASLAGNQFNLKVRNRIKAGQSLSPQKNGGIGLNNLKNRMELLSAKYKLTAEAKGHFFYSELNITLK